MSPGTYFRFTSVGQKRDACLSNGEGGVELLLLMRCIIGQHTLLSDVMLFSFLELGKLEEVELLLLMR